MQLHHPLAHGVDNLLVVGGHDHCGASPVDGIQDLHDAQGGGWIKIACGLICQQNFRIVDVGPGQSHTLGLAAGKLVGVVVLLAGQPHSLEHLRH